MLGPALGLLIVLTAVPGASAAGIEIGYDRVRADLDPANTAYLEEEKYAQPALLETGATLWISDYNRASDLRVARAFADRLGQEAGLIWLLGRLGGQSLPAFTGRRVTADGRTLANLKMVEATHDVADLGQLIINYVAKIERYGTSAPWTEFLMNWAREIKGLRRNGGQNVFVVEGARAARYLDAVVSTRRMMQLFAVDARRPAQIYLRALDATSIDERELANWANLLTPGQLTTDVFVLQDNDRIIRIGPRSAERLAGCGRRLDE